MILILSRFIAFWLLLLLYVVVLGVRGEVEAAELLFDVAGRLELGEREGDDGCTDALLVFRRDKDPSMDGFSSTGNENSCKYLGSCSNLALRTFMPSTKRVTIAESMYKIKMVSKYILNLYKNSTHSHAQW